MALSNWDTMAWDTTGKPCIGEVTVDGYKLEIYKNWVHLFGRKGKVMSWIRSGNLDISLPGSKYTLHIISKRGLQNGIYLFACFSKWDGMKSIKEYLFGIGCSGYSDIRDSQGDYEWVGVLPETEKDFLEWINKYEPIYSLKEIKISENCSELVDDKLTGEYYKIDEDIPELQKGLRYCPGDKFFAEHGVISEIPATESGKAVDTVVEKMLKESKNA